MNETVGIIMPAYNAERTLKRSIESVIEQYYQNWKLYIINDCSSDSTKSIISNYLHDERITYIENKNNLGAALTRNEGLKASSENIICFIDSDDEWVKDKLLMQIETYRKGYDFIIGSYNLIYKDKTKKVSYCCEKMTHTDFLKKKTKVCFPTLFFSRNGINYLFDDCGHEDFIFISNIFQNKKECYFESETLVNCYHVDGSLSSNKFKAAIWHYKALRKICKRNYFKVFYLYIYYIINGLVFRI